MLTDKTMKYHTCGNDTAREGKTVKGSFFPENIARIQANESSYSTIAFRALCDAEKIYKELLQDDEKFLDPDETFMIDECVAVCETFSAFAVEGYLNTYAAACLGDDMFYDNFEKLSVLSKLQLITALLYHESIDKGGELHYLIKNLFSSRDSHAHSKNMSISGKYGVSEKAIEEYEKLFSEHWKEELDDTIKSIKSRYQDEIKGAELSVKAIAAVACFIDAHDTTAFAQFRLLPFSFEGKIEKPQEESHNRYTTRPVEYRQDMRKKALSLVNHYNSSFEQ